MKLTTKKKGGMITRTGSVIVVTLALALAACGSDAGPASTTSTTAATSTPSGTETTAPVESTVASPASAEPTEQPAAFPIATFADIREDPVSEEAAAEFQAILSDMAGGAGMAATVMSADGTWSGAAGKADGVRDVRVDDQFAIASVTKSVIAAQVMQMV
jgi:CubicO group peptidase (beta-lactamase class C family)